MASERLVYKCERKGLPSLAEQDATLRAAGLTEAELADAYVDRGRPRQGEPAQPERDHIVGAARPGDEVWMARPAVVATTEDDALRFLARISEHGTVLCIASTGARYSAPPEAQEAVASGLRLAADIKRDERAAVLERARKGIRGKPAGKPAVGPERMEAARVFWFDATIDGDEAARRAGIGRRTLHRHFGPRETPAFGKPRGRKPQ
ncbi:MAG: hypothetical protein K2X46_06760 [Roseomonas sp.]|nr:hypothetical protein [Roseomonas sp.]